MIQATQGLPSPRSGHSNNFDCLRLAAALAVLVSHQHALWGLPEPGLAGVHSLGGMGVLVFFSISGFLVAQSWASDPHVGRFAARRLLRLWPGLAVAVLACALLLGPAVSQLPWRDYFADPLVPRYLKNLYFGFRDGLPLRFEGSALPEAVNGSLWTLPLEFKCYVVLAVLGSTGLLRPRWRRAVATVTLGVAAVYMVLPADGLPWPQLQSWVPAQRHYLLEFGLFFFAGVLLHSIRLDAMKRRSLIGLLAISWLVAAAAWAAGLGLLAVWVALPCTVLVVGLASTPGLRQAGRFGDLSYGIYIYAFPVQQTVVWLYKDRINWSESLLLVLALTLVLAAASWHMVEKQALKLKPRTRQATVINATGSGACTEASALTASAPFPGAQTQSIALALDAGGLACCIALHGLALGVARGIGPGPPQHGQAEW
jgi:peptidoglycan/LPS O-acetylase OafA/YrhL